MNANGIRYVVDESFKMLARRKGANAVSTIIMGLSLLILVVFLLVTLNIAGFIDRTSEELRVYVYLRDGIDEDTSRAIQFRLLGMDGVREVVFVSRDEALEEFREALGGESDLLDALEENPLPDAYRVQLRQDRIRSPILGSFAEAVGGWEGVEEVRYGKRWFERGEKLVRGFYAIDLGLGLIVFLSVVFVISNTVRLTILQRRRTIDVMKYVGATNAYIRTPFVVEGAAQGAAAAVMAIGLLLGIHLFALRYLPGIVFFRWDAVAGFVLFCALLGALGSVAAMRRFLRL
ncbi:MAG: ABC transporter permease [Candidatus Krumholzibacteriota bacterium]|nr:ABC transporter permease [Candidatus Krumholzibacteriota bacterium]